MKLEIFSVWDDKARAHIVPFFLPNKDMAMRSFHDAGADPLHMFGKHPEDYRLYKMGEFEDTTGKFTLLDKPENLGFPTQHLQSIEDIVPLKDTG